MLPLAMIHAFEIQYSFFENIFLQKSTGIGLRRVYGGGGVEEPSLYPTFFHDHYFECTPKSPFLRNLA